VNLNKCVAVGSAKQFWIPLTLNSVNITYYLGTGTEICNSCGVHKHTYQNSLSM